MSEQSQIRRTIAALVTGALALGVTAASHGDGTSPSQESWESWDFDTGLGDWHDGGGAPELGFYSLGRDYSTQEADIRSGWRSVEEGRDGTSGVQGRRMNATVMNGSLRSPYVEVPLGRESVAVTMWFRWGEYARPTEHVTLTLYGGLAESEVTLVPDPESLDDWQSVTIETRVSPHGPYGRRSVYVMLWSKFEEPRGDCTANTYWVFPGECDLGFTMDDVSLTWT